MRVVVVCRTNGAFSGGTSKYLNRLIPLLREQPGLDHVDVYVPRLALGGMDASVQARTWKGGRGLRDALSVIRDSKPDVIYVPTARAVAVRKTPLVIMVRNMEPLVAPFRHNSARDGMKNAARREAARNACLRARRIIAVSRAVRSFLTQKWHIPAERIAVVYHGAGESMLPERAVRPAGAPNAPFVFTAGSIRPYRGLEDAIRALAALEAMGRSMRLCVAGEAHPTSQSYANRLRQMASDAGVAGSIHWLGLLNPAEMAWCYLHCEAFVTTSRVEACPNTVLEALAHGCVMVSTSSAPMPEIIGDAGYYYPADHADDLAQILANLRVDARSIHRHAAFMRANSFRWSVTASLTASNLLAAAGRNVPTPARLEPNSETWLPSS